MKSKFKEYLLLNMNIVRKDMRYTVLLGLALGIAERLGFLNFDENNISGIIVPVVIVCIPLFWKLCSQVLYEQEAYFYQSFPVSNGEVVLTKTLITSLGMFICMLAFGLINIQHIWLLPIGVLISFTVSNIVFYSITTANMFKNSRAKKPSAIIAVILTYILIIIQVWLAELMIFDSFIPDKYEMVILAIFLLTESAAFFYGNVRNMRLYYRV